MRISFLVLALLLVIPITAEGHAEIFFPRLFSPAELATSGFVFLNADPTIATVNFYLVGADGLADGKKPVSAPPAVQIPPGGQLARLGSEMFPDATSSGWVYVITDTEGMQAFWLIYDAALTSLDGAEAEQYDTIGPDQVIPLVAGDTEVNVISVNGTTIPVTITLFGSNGQLAPSITRNIAIAGAFQGSAAAMFPTADMTQARYIRIRTITAPIASSALIKGFQVPLESAVVNGLNVSSSTAMIFPHIINGGLAGANYTTIVGVTNLSSSTQTITITFNTDQSGTTSVTRTLPGNGAFRETAQSLFNLPPDFQSGWIQVSGTAPITGFAAYSDSVAGALAAVPASAPQTKLFFSHIADGPPQWQTGLALLNPGTTTANVEVYAMTPSGSLIGSVTVNVDPGKKIAKVIHELIPQTQGVNGGFVFVRSTNNVPLYGIELFYTEDLKVLSNVAAGKVVVAYAPPSP